jgi:hypothetical protein
MIDMSRFEPNHIAQSTKIVKTIHHPCIYCPTETITYILESDTKEQTDSMIQFHTFMIRLHMFENHKDMIFIKSDHPYINEKGELEDNVQF